jgi:hypothetical protein
MALIAVSFILLTACASPERLVQRGWEKYNQRDFLKSEVYFSKSLKKRPYQDDAYRGLAFVNANGFNNYRNAEYYMGEAYRLNSNASNTYNYACFTNRNGHAQKAMELLFELPDKNQFDYFRKQAATDSDLSSLKSNPKFVRYLSGYRRIKVEPYFGYCFDSDGLFSGENDLFLLVENQGKIILVTNVVQNSNRANWNDYVVFDYPLNSSVRFLLMDEDNVKHDKYTELRTVLNKPGSFSSGNSQSGFRFRVSDSENSVYTTGTDLPAEISLSSLALGYGIYQEIQSRDSDNSFYNRLIDCAVVAGISYFVENIAYATVITEAYNRVRNQQGSSFYSLSASVIKSLMINQLKKGGHPTAALALEGIDFLNCLFNK